MKIVVGGASGFLGNALVERLRADGHEVTRLVRTRTGLEGTSLWDPSAGRIDQVIIDRADAVVNLSGASIARWPRTRSYLRTLMSSRIEPTSTIVKAIVNSPEPPMLLSASAMGFYGTDRGIEVLPETADAGPGPLAEITHAWEAATAPAAEAGARVSHLRTSLVLHASGGALKPMLPAFKLGAGAKLGSGQQYMSFISRDDWVRAVIHLLENDLAGPFNLSTPTPVTNAEFTDTFGDVLGRPTVLKAPGFALKAALGGLAGDLLGSLRLQPSALAGAGFEFEHPDLKSALQAALADD